MPGHQRHADARFTEHTSGADQSVNVAEKLKAGEHSLMVTRLAWMAQRLQSSIKWTMKSSVACSRDGRAL